MTKQFDDYKKCIVDGDFLLSSGEKLNNLELAYKTFGKLNKNKSNAILICHSLSSNTHVCSETKEDTSGWWEPIVGSGKFIDTNKFFVICVNNLGGCFGSTGPNSINVNAQRIYGKDFPAISINDMVRSHKKVIEHLNIESLYAVIGGSMGGIIALEWATVYAKIVKRLILISSCGQVPPSALAAHSIQRAILSAHQCNDAMKDCHYCHFSFMLARKIGLLTYRSFKELNNRFANDTKAVESYLEYNSLKFVKNFNKNTYLLYLNAMDNYSPQHLENITADTLIISVDSDTLFPQETQISLYNEIKKHQSNCFLIKHQSDLGHDAFFKDEKIGYYMQQFLNDRSITEHTKRGVGILSAIGQTPLIQLEKLKENNQLHFNVYAKLELNNPGGSVKDRPSKAILLKALEKGLINQGTTIIEYSSGNMGIGLSQACAYLGLKFICVIDPRCSQETIKIMQSYGTTILKIEEPDPATNEYLPAAINKIKHLITIMPNSYWTNQHGNLDNAAAHYHTFQEIHHQLGHIDYLFCATSTCGTLRGCGEYIKAHKLDTKIIAVDALGSSIFSNVKHKRVIPGHGAGLVPAILDKSLVHETIFASGEDSVAGARHLLQCEAILAGGSTGALVAGILAYRQQIKENSHCVMIIADRGERYLNTIYSNEWCDRNLSRPIINKVAYYEK